MYECMNVCMLQTVLSPCMLMALVSEERTESFVEVCMYKYVRMYECLYVCMYVTTSTLTLHADGFSLRRKNGAVC